MAHAFRESLAALHDAVVGDMQYNGEVNGFGRDGMKP
jgi:hypothetical protein